MSEERLISAEAVEEELIQDRALRPKMLVWFSDQSWP